LLAGAAQGACRRRQPLPRIVQIDARGRARRPALGYRSVGGNRVAATFRTRRSASIREASSTSRGGASLMAALVALVVAFASSGGGARAQTASTPTRCRVGTYVIALYDFDYAANTFNADVWLWSVCPTADIKPLDTIEFINANETTTRLQTFEPVGNVFWATRKISGTFREDWDLRNFPFDQHTLSIVLENGDQNASQFRFEPDTAQSTYDRDMPLPGWRIVEFRLTERPAVYQTTFGDPALPPNAGSQYSRLNVEVDIARSQLSTFFQLTSVVYAAFLLSLIVYFFHVEAGSALGIQMGLLAGALFATAINLASASATLGHQNGLTLIDLIHIVVLLYILAAAVVALGSRFLLERGWTQAAIARLNHAAFGVAALSFLALNAGLILRAARAG
jgi:hypothetical protein